MVRVYKHNYRLPATLMPCQCEAGSLQWNESRRAWLCNAPECQRGLALGGLLEVDDFCLQHGRVDLRRVPLTDYGLVLVATGAVTLPGLIDRLGATIQLGARQTDRPEDFETYGVHVARARAGADSPDLMETTEEIGRLMRQMPGRGR